MTPTVVGIVVLVIGDGDHAVPSSIGFKVVGVGMDHRMSHLEFAQVGDQVPTAVSMNTDHAVGNIRHTMRTTGAREHGIKSVSNESDISHATDQTSSVRTRLA